MVHFSARPQSPRTTTQQQSLDSIELTTAAPRKSSSPQRNERRAARTCAARHTHRERTSSRVGALARDERALERDRVRVRRVRAPRAREVLPADEVSPEDVYTEPAVLDGDAHERDEPIELADPPVEPVEVPCLPVPLERLLPGRASRQSPSRLWGRGQGDVPRRWR